MSKGSRFFLCAVLVLFTWMVLTGWETDSLKSRIGSGAFAAFMLILAAGLIAPTRLRVAFRIVAACVGLAYCWYFFVELRALLAGEHQVFKRGVPSALMAGLGLLIFGVPAIVFALGGVTTGWVDRLLARAAGRQSPDEASNE